MKTNERKGADMTIGIVLGGGAPNSTLIAGALSAFAERGVRFDVMSTAGAGALMGLLFCCPRDKTPVEALRQWSRVGITDGLYHFLPVNHKVFARAGDWTHKWRAGVMEGMGWMLRGNPEMSYQMDVMNLAMTALSPFSLGKGSLGLCENLPWVEDLVDFGEARGMGTRFFMNAFNLDDSRMEVWGNEKLTADHMKAAFAFPLIYPPYEVDGATYIEGAAVEPMNFAAMEAEEGRVDTVVVADILGDWRLIRKPRNLYDAWVKSIVTPLVPISVGATERYVEGARARGKRVLRLDFFDGMPDEWFTEMFDWSETNMGRLFEWGRVVGMRAADELRGSGEGI